MKSETINNEWKKSVTIRDKWKYDFNDEIDFPYIIQLQLHSYCNAACVMCPYGKVHDKLSNGNMDVILFQKIISECKEYQRKFEFLPFLMNEPMLSNKTPYFLTGIKNNFPKSAISLYTNGSCKDKKLWEEVLDLDIDSIVFSANSIDEKEYFDITGGLSYEIFKNNILWVKNYIEKNKLSTEILIQVIRMNKSIEEMLKFINYWKKYGIICRTTYLENRAGNIDLNAYTQKQSILAPNKCWRVLSQIHILYNGDVILCCGDWNREVVLGNVRNESIREIWNKKEYIKIRKAHKEHMRENMPLICQRCNMV